MSSSIPPFAIPNPAGNSTSGTDGKIFGRVIKLLVSNNAGAALDLSSFHIKFKVKKSGIMTPNTADIIIYNLDVTTAALIKAEFTTVTLQAGYVGNFGVIFKGNIKWSTVGRESPVDTFLNLVCGDGDQAYNYAIINQTLSPGASPAVVLNTALKPLAAQGVGQSYVGALPVKQLPRGKTMYGNSREYLKRLADDHGFTWSIQDEKVVFISQGTYLPGDAVELTSKTGMIGTPTQTIEGVMVSSFLNPKLKCHGRVHINQASIAAFKIDINVPGSAANTPVPTTLDGFYYILVAEHDGDTRGNDWDTNMQTLVISVTSNPLNGINAGVGQ